MASRAVGKGERTRTDAILSRSWLVVAAVALFVALPVLILGQASENDTRARFAAAQAESATRAADAVTSNFNDRTQLIRDTLAALAVQPRPDASPLSLAVQQGDTATLQAFADSVRLLYARNVLSTDIAVRGQADSISDATIVAASPAGSGQVGQRLSNLGRSSIPSLRQVFNVEIGFSDAFPGTADAPSRVVLSATIPASGGRDLQTRYNLASATIEAELDLARTFAEFSAPFLGPGDDAYLLNGRRLLLGRARGPTAFPLRDLRDSPFVQLLGSTERVTRVGVVDPLGGETRLIAGTRLVGADWWVLVLRDTSAVDREIDAVLAQLAAARYLLVALLLVGTLVIGRAASSTVRQRRALAEANVQTEAASLHKSAFLASMSHELRTPLNSINGFSDVLLDGMAGPLSDKQREYLSDIRGSGAQLLTLINDVLDLSKVEAGKMEIQLTTFDLHDAIERVRRAVTPLADQKHQTLTVTVDPHAGTIHLDEVRLRQVLLNLLSNAVKYTPDGGSIATSVARRDGTIEIAVRDSGIGIAPGDQARVFDDFARVETGYARAQQGTGLGLALARRLVRLMGGDIGLVSAPGQGSTFTISVPAGSLPSDKAIPEEALAHNLPP